MKNINTIETNSVPKPQVEQETPANEAVVLREKLENDGGYNDEADMLAEIWTHLREHGIESDEDLLFTGHNTAVDSQTAREETFAVTAEEYAQALAYHHGETPLQYIIEDEEGTPTVSVYDGKRLLPMPSAIKTKYKALPGHTIEDALIAQFDVSDWT